MEGNHRLIGVGRACCAINTNGLVGMEIQWTLDRLCIYAVIREHIACHWQSSWEPFVYCKPPLLQPRCTKYLSTGSNLTIALGRELFDTFTVGKASLEAEERRRMRILIFILWSVALCLRTQSFSTGRLYETRAHTLEPTSHHTGGQRKSGVASVSSPAWVTSLFTALCPPQSCTCPSPIPRGEEVYRDGACCCVVKCQQGSFSELGCSLGSWIKLHCTWQERRILMICIRCSGAGIPPHLSTTIWHLAKNEQQILYSEFPLGRALTSRRRKQFNEWNYKFFSNIIGCSSLIWICIDIVLAAGLLPKPSLPFVNSKTFNTSQRNFEIEILRVGHSLFVTAQNIEFDYESNWT